ncbi:MAG: hypothetical protein ACLGG0_04860 [Bacteriovoracia bacterium]
MFHKIQNLQGSFKACHKTLLDGLPYFLGILLMFSPLSLWAARDAVVIKERAVIWADAQRSAPLGYARRGRTLRVGDKEREKGQVVSVIVSGKVAYISVEDISIDEDRKKIDIEEVTLTRFQEATKPRYRDQMVFAVVKFNATESADTAAGRLEKEWNFQGGQLKGEIRTTSERLNVGFMFEYLYGESQQEAFRIFELGMGVSWAMVNTRNFKIRAEAMGLLVPWAQYEAAPLFTLNGYGLGAIGQLSANYYFNETWGLEVAGGIQAVKLFGIKRPSPFQEFSPMFMGPRLSIGLTGRF